MGVIERKAFGKLTPGEIMKAFILIILECCVAPLLQTVASGQTVVTTKQEVRGTPLGHAPREVP